MNVVDVPISEIYEDSELNCRGEVTPFSVIELAKSIQEKGLQQPISIEPYDKKPGYKYRIILGYRRFKAFKINKLQTIPCIIQQGLSEIQARVINFTENIERKQLDMLQEAVTIKKFKDLHYTLQETANMLGVSTGWVHIRYLLLDLEPEVQSAAKAGFLTQEQIKDLYSMNTREQRFDAVKQIKESKLRGDKKSIKLKKAKKNIVAKKLRNKEEIFEMQEHIINSIGSNFGSRCLAWASGEISDLELYRDIKQIANQRGKLYSIPSEMYSTV